MRLMFVVLAMWLCLPVAGERASIQQAPTPESPRAQVTIESWDKGGALSHWVHTHMSEVFASAVARRGGPLVELQVQIRPAIRGLNSNKPGEPDQTLISS